jgi:hypothetical protein
MDNKTSHQPQWEAMEELEPLDKWLLPVKLVAVGLVLHMVWLPREATSSVLQVPKQLKHLGAHNSGLHSHSLVFSNLGKYLNLEASEEEEEVVVETFLGVPLAVALMIPTQTLRLI